jgi:hypothetical protein
MKSQSATRLAFLISISKLQVHVVLYQAGPFGSPRISSPCGTGHGPRGCGRGFQRTLSRTHGLERMASVIVRESVSRSGPFTNIFGQAGV